MCEKCDEAEAKLTREERRAIRESEFVPIFASLEVAGKCSVSDEVKDIAVSLTLKAEAEQLTGKTYTSVGEADGWTLMDALRTLAYDLPELSPENRVWVASALTLRHALQAYSQRTPSSLGELIAAAAKAAGAEVKVVDIDELIKEDGAMKVPFDGKVR